MITAALIGAREPRLVQIGVSSTVPGERWVVVGSASGLTWTVPGAEGMGDGGAVTLIDNRALLNTPVTYTLASDSSNENSTAVTVATSDDVDVVIESLDGQRLLSAQLSDGTEVIEMAPAVELYEVPGRRNPASRYTATSNPFGVLVVRVPIADSPAMDALLSDGEPLLVRLSQPTFDLPPVQVVQVTSIAATGFLVGAYRHWRLGYRRVDDPFMDRRLGAYTWDFIDSLQAQGAAVIRDGDAMEQLLSGLTWDQIDAYDWSVVP